MGDNTKTYAIMYDDSMYLTYDLTDDDFQAIQHHLINNTNYPYCPVSIGIIGLKGIRSIIEQRPITNVPEAANPPMSLTEQDFYNQMKGDQDAEEYR